MSDAEPRGPRREWFTDDPTRVVAKGHPIGDFLEAYEWRVIEEHEGFLRIAAHLPDQVKNPRGELFGGFAPTYVDFVALHTVWSGRRTLWPRPWLTTASMHVDYFAPIRDGAFVIEGEELNRGGRTHHIQVRFLQADGGLLANAQATIIELREASG